MFNQRTTLAIGGGMLAVLLAVPAYAALNHRTARIGGGRTISLRPEGVMVTLRGDNWYPRDSIKVYVDGSYYGSLGATETWNLDLCGMGDPILTLDNAQNRLEFTVQLDYDGSSCDSSSESSRVR